MKDPDHPDATLQMHLRRDSSLCPMGTIWIPLQILGTLKGFLWRSSVKLAGTLAPAAKSYGYWQTLVEPMESDDSQQEVRRQTQLTYCA